MCVTLADVANNDASPDGCGLLAEGGPIVMGEIIVRWRLVVVRSTQSRRCRFVEQA